MILQSGGTFGHYLTAEDTLQIKESAFAFLHSAEAVTYCTYSSVAHSGRKDVARYLIEIRAAIFEGLLYMRSLRTF